MPLLDVRNLSVSFATRGGAFRAVDAEQAAAPRDQQELMQVLMSVRTDFPIMQTGPLADGLHVDETRSARRRRGADLAVEFEHRNACDIPGGAMGGGVGQ